jgi:hypothetical protein
MLLDFILVFGVTIAVIRVVRRMNKAGTLPPTELADTGSPAKRTPSNQFHDEVWLPLCERIAVAVTQRTGRELTLHERRRIWETRAPLILETALKEIEAGDDGSISPLIYSLPTGLRRPDPTNWMHQALS